ncbi:hypothetical protein KFL_002580205, partial [Klebsormidium nitens]
QAVSRRRAALKLCPDGGPLSSCVQTEGHSQAVSRRRATLKLCQDGGPLSRRWACRRPNEACGRSCLGLLPGPAEVTPRRPDRSSKTAVRRRQSEDGGRRPRQTPAAHAALGRQQRPNSRVLLYRRGSRRTRPTLAAAPREGRGQAFHVRCPRHRSPATRMAVAAPDERAASFQTRPPPLVTNFLAGEGAAPPGFSVASPGGLHPDVLQPPKAGGGVLGVPSSPSEAPVITAGFCWRLQPAASPPGDVYLV